MSKKSTMPLRVGKAIRKKREALNISQEGFADELGVHRTYYSAIERGEKDIRVSTLERVCRTLGAKMADVLKDLD